MSSFASLNERLVVAVQLNLTFEHICAPSQDRSVDSKNLAIVN